MGNYKISRLIKTNETVNGKISPAHIDVRSPVDDLTNNDKSSMNRQGILNKVGIGIIFHAQETFQDVGEMSDLMIAV